MTATVNSSKRAGLEPGHGRLGAVIAYFHILTVLSAAIAIGAALTGLFPQLGWHTRPSDPWLAAVGAGVMSVGFHRTAQFLRLRQRIGGIAALICFGASVVPAVNSVSSALLSVGIATTGIVALGSVWRYLQ